MIGSACHIISYAAMKLELHYFTLLKTYLVKIGQYDWDNRKSTRKVSKSTAGHKCKMINKNYSHKYCCQKDTYYDQ